MTPGEYRVFPCGKGWAIANSTHKCSGVYESRALAQSIADGLNAEHDRDNP